MLHISCDPVIWGPPTTKDLEKRINIYEDVLRRIEGGENPSEVVDEVKEIFGN
ncbi:MAG: hypothetical protein Q8O83_01700 [bacterium]|nr:hypothetical protein [bacterium]